MIRSRQMKIDGCLEPHKIFYVTNTPFLRQAIFIDFVKFLIILDQWVGAAWKGKKENDGKEINND